MADISLAEHRPAPAAPAVSLRGVAKQFGPLQAVDGVDLDIPPGEILGLIGHNGAGKSTLFKMMLGLLPVTAGQITVQGTPVTARQFRQVRRHLGYLPENVVLYDNLSGPETLRFFARLKGADPAHCPAVLERVGLAHAGQRPVRTYSKGMRQRLGFAQALLGQPRVLFLDEPTNGLDPAAIRGFYDTLRGLQAEGVTVVITSHILAELQERVDRVAIMVSGRIEATGSIQALREQTQLPLTLEVELSGAHQTAALLALAPLPGVQVVPTAIGLRLQLPRDQKMAVMGALTGLGAVVRDFKLIEPSLEDMFFGFSA